MQIVSNLHEMSNSVFWKKKKKKKEKNLNLSTAEILPSMLSVKTRVYDNSLFHFIKKSRVGPTIKVVYY